MATKSSLVLPHKGSYFEVNIQRCGIDTVINLPFVLYFTSFYLTRELINRSIDSKGNRFVQVLPVSPQAISKSSMCRQNDVHGVVHVFWCKNLQVVNLEINAHYERVRL